MDVLRFMVLLILFSAVVSLFGGCASGPTKLPPPSGRLLAPPTPFPKIGANDDARAKLVEAALAHQKNASRLKDLQEWAREAAQ